MNNRWAIEAHDKTGRTFVFRPAVTDEQVDSMVAELLTYDTTGGIVIYRSVVAESNNKGGDNDAGKKELGLVTNARFTYCRYCETKGGHTADCPVIS